MQDVSSDGHYTGMQKRVGLSSSVAHPTLTPAMQSNQSPHSFDLGLIPFFMDRRVHVFLILL